jgi:hypothetical protein
MRIREFVTWTLQVYPIKGYGAIELGVHRFHHPGEEKEFPAAVGKPHLTPDLDLYGSDRDAF